MAELIVQTRNRQGNSLCICLLCIHTWESISNQMLYIMEGFLWCFVFKTEIAVWTFLDKQTIQKTLYHVFFITLAKVCEGKHFASKLLISCVQASIKGRLRTPPSNPDDFSFFFLFKHHVERVQCKGHSCVELNSICNVTDTRDRCFRLHCKFFHWHERSSVLTFTKCCLLTVRMEAESLTKGTFFWGSVMPGIT